MSTATTNRVEVRCPDCQSVRTVGYSRYAEIRAGASARCHKCGNVQRRAAGPRPQPYRNDHTWRLSAACDGMDTDIWFPVSESGKFTNGGRRPENAAVQAAKGICGMCEVRQACLEDAIAVGDSYGIRGGMTAAERKRLVEARNRKKVAE